MTPAHAAALTSARDSFAMLREAIAGLPDAAMDWTPAPGTNSVAVLAMHSIAACRFLFACGSGAPGSVTAYRAGERAAAFKANGMTTAQVLADIDSFVPELETILSKGQPEHLDAEIGFDEDPTFGSNGIGFLVRAAAHVREHVGQAQLMRDLWNAR